jgi:ribonuclease HI
MDSSYDDGYYENEDENWNEDGNGDENQQCSTMSRYYDPIRYKFDPSVYGTSRPVESCRGDWVYLACPYSQVCHVCHTPIAHYDCLVIAVDSAGRGTGTRDASAAIGVYVGKTSVHNMSAALKLPKYTTQAAELKAAIAGLALAVRLKESGGMKPEIVLLVLKTDSETVVSGVTERWPKWKENGFKTNRNPLKNPELYVEIMDLVGKLENLGLDVLFWKVPKLHNKEAERLSKMGLPKVI